MAASGLLPVQGVRPRRHAARHVPRARGEDGARPVGQARQRLKTARACRMREVLQGICMDSRPPAGAWVGLYRLCSWMMRSRFESMKDFARMIRRRFAGTVAHFGHPYANAVLEGADSVIQNVKRRARGLRNMDCFAAMIYLACGKPDLKAVTAV